MPPEQLSTTSPAVADFPSSKAATETLKPAIDLKDYSFRACFISRQRSKLLIFLA
jgi:hypothetical protein